MDKVVLKNTQTFVEEIVKQIGFAECNVEVDVTEAEEKYHVSVNVNGEGLELLIGYHGKNLNALHQVITNYIRRQMPQPEEGEDPKRVSLFLDVGGYYEKQNEKVRAQASQAVEEVRLLDEPYEFQPMSPRLRRIVHMALQEYDDVKTESTGEGSSRRVVIYPKTDETPSTEE